MENGRVSVREEEGCVMEQTDGLRERGAAQQERCRPRHGKQP